MTKTKFRQMLDKLQAVNERREFRFHTKDALTSELGVSFASVEDAIIGEYGFDDLFSSKRRAYNYAVVELLSQFQLFPEDLYADLDRAWQAVTKEKAITSKAVKFAVGFVPGWSVARARGVWKEYQKRVRDVVEELGQASL